MEGGSRAWRPQLPAAAVRSQHAAAAPPQQPPLGCCETAPAAQGAAAQTPCPSDRRQLASCRPQPARQLDGWHGTAAMPPRAGGHDPTRSNRQPLQSAARWPQAAALLALPQPQRPGCPLRQAATAGGAPPALLCGGLRPVLPRPQAAQQASGAAAAGMPAPLQLAMRHAALLHPWRLQRPGPGPAHSAAPAQEAAAAPLGSTLPPALRWERMLAAALPPQAGAAAAPAVSPNPAGQQLLGRAWGATPLPSCTAPAHTRPPLGGWPGP